MNNRRKTLLSLGAGGLSLLWSSAPIAKYRFRKSTGFAVMDIQGDGTVVGYDENKQKHPASLTKLMTAEIVMGALINFQADFNLNSLVEIPHLIKDVRSDVYALRQLRAGDKVPAKDLLIAMGARSDAFSTLALALHVGSKKVLNWGGSEKDKFYKFLSEMNKRAIEIGMMSSNFNVITGAPSENHYSTPRDIAVLMKHIQETYPNLAELSFGQPNFHLIQYKSSQHHTSRLLRQHPEEVKWAKTGYTDAAGFCLSVYYNKNNVPLFGVVMGERSESGRNNSMVHILEQGYKIVHPDMLKPKL